MLRVGCCLPTPYQNFYAPDSSRPTIYFQDANLDILVRTTFMWIANYFVQFLIADFKQNQRNNEKKSR